KATPHGASCNRGPAASPSPRLGRLALTRTKGPDFRACRALYTRKDQTTDVANTTRRIFDDPPQDHARRFAARLDGRSHLRPPLSGVPGPWKRAPTAHDA